MKLAYLTALHIARENSPAESSNAWFWREPWWILNGTAVIFWALLRRATAGKQPDSIFRLLDFDAGGNSGRACARRALALILTTLPPNSVVIGIDQEKDSMFVHQLQQSGEPDVMKELK